MVCLHNPLRLAIVASHSADETNVSVDWSEITNCVFYVVYSLHGLLIGKLFFLLAHFISDSMKETTAKRREKPKDSKAEKQKDAGPEPQDVEMPEEDSTTAEKKPKELDTLTLEGS